MKCPHCRTAFNDRDKQIRYLDSTQGGERIQAGFWGWYVGYSQCPECGKLIVRLANQEQLNTYQGGSRQLQSSEGGDWTEWLVYPRATTRAPVPPEVPSDFAEDYTEACLVFSDSPKASAALSRRCLQNTLREKAGVGHSNLASEIQEVLTSNQLPSYLASDLDAVRHTGNFAAHPIKSQQTGAVLPVEAGEAEWNLDVIESLFDFYFVAPARAQARREALNQKLEDAGKKPMKSSDS